MYKIEKFNEFDAPNPIERRPMYCRIEDDGTELYYDAYVLYGNLALIIDAPVRYAELSVIEPHADKPGYWREAYMSPHIMFNHVGPDFFRRVEAATKVADLLALVSDAMQAEVEAAYDAK